MADHELVLAEAGAERRRSEMRWWKAWINA